MFGGIQNLDPNDSVAFPHIQDNILGEAPVHHLLLLVVETHVQKIGLCIIENPYKDVDRYSGVAEVSAPAAER